MRLDDLVVIGLLAAVVAVDLARGGGASPIGLVFAAAAAVLYLLAGRRRPAQAPAPAPPHPAVLVLARNDALTVADVVRRAGAHLPVFVLDDASHDGTPEAARAAGAEVLSHPRRRGRGAALLAGMRLAARYGHTHVICLSADGSHDPADIPRFVAALREEPLAVHAGALVGLRSHGSSLLLWAETGWRTASASCGFRAWPIAPVLGLRLIGTGDELEPELLARSVWTGIPVRDVPCRPGPPRRLGPGAYLRLAAMHAMLLTERLMWPPRWFLRLRSPERPGLALARVQRLFGRRVAGALATGVAAARALRTRAAPATLARVLPGATARSVAFQAHRAALHASLDAAAFAARGPRDLRYVFEGREHLRAAFSGSGAILLTGHLGNPAVLPTPDGARAHVHLDAADELSALRVLRAGGVVLLAGDRAVDDRVVPVEFLGAPARFAASPWLLAALADVPVIVVGVFAEPGRYRVIAYPPAWCGFDRGRVRGEQLAAWAQRYADQLGALSRRYPTQLAALVDGWTDEVEAPGLGARRRTVTDLGLPPP